MSHFRKDLRQEMILSEFLDKSYLKENLTMFRVTDLSLQHKGVDLIYYRDGALNFKIDEKAQLHYINKDLPTFALEISYLKNNNLKSGWLFDTHKITEIYAFIFSIHLKEGITSLTNAKDIKSCDLIFVNRLRLINELAILKLDAKFCNDVSLQLRNENEVLKVEHQSGFNFQISKHLEEQPVNLIVKRTFLERIGRLYRF